jgi:Na+/H+ antiporter NhaD/arsenite permease-like protein
MWLEMYHSLTVLVLAAVLLLIAIRQVGGLKLQIWQVMLGGALACLFSGEISAAEALLAINPDVMIFLFCMFLVGEALEESGYLFHLSYQIFRRAKNQDQLVIMIIFVVGILSAILMNDTLAIVGTPLVLYFARVHCISPKLLLLSLAFAVTTGSALSPIGNPQNLLIALYGDVSNPFLTFARYLALPTLLNLLLVFLLLKLFFRDGFSNGPLNHNHEDLRDAHLARLSRLSLILLAAMIGAKVALVMAGSSVSFSLTSIAVAAALPVALSHRRLELVRKVDWATLIFFASMFVLMESVWQSGFLQLLMDEAQMDLKSVPVILATSVILSQVISNVPFVALYLPVIGQAGATSLELAALAAGSTIAGNLFILGAASNVIIIQNAEREGETLTFGEFARVGVPLTMANVAVYWIFLAM